MESVYFAAQADWALSNVKTVLFQTIQFCISTQFVCAFFYTQSNVKTVNFKQYSLVQLQFSSIWDTEIGPYQVIPLPARVDLEAMAMKGYSAFPKVLAFLKPHLQIVYCQI